jgi:hypothetical protein
MNSEFDTQTTESSDNDRRRPEPNQQREAFHHNQRFIAKGHAQRYEPDSPGSLWSNRGVKFGFLTVLLGLFLGLVFYWWTVAPLQKKLAAREVHTLAEQIDAAVKLRAELVRAASVDLKVENLNAPGALDSVRLTLRRAFPDFLSLEIVNEEGDLLAMVGDIALAEGKPSSAPFLSGPGNSGAQAPNFSFRDDPGGRSFFIDEAHRTPGGEPWFTRARFSRDMIERILNSSKSPLHATLVKAPVAAAAITGVDRDTANMRTDLLGSLTWIEAPLSVSGWWVRMESVPRPSVASRLSLKTVALIFLILTVALLILRWNSTIKRPTPEDKSGDQLTVTDNSPGKIPSPQEGHSVPSIADSTLCPRVEQQNRDDLFPRAAADELFRSFPRPLEKKAAASEASGPARENPALDGVFTSPEFMEEFSEVVAPPIRDHAMDARHSEEEAHISGALSSPDDTDLVLAEPLFEDELPKSGAGNVATGKDHELPEVLELVWAEPFAVEPEEKAGSAESAEDRANASSTPKVAMIPESLDVQWIEPAEEETPARTAAPSPGPHRTA